jgi:hypothetical protein
MKSVTEILGGSQILLGISYNLQDIFEDYHSANHPNIEMKRAVTGRKKTILEIEPL